MEQKIITAHSATELNWGLIVLAKEGWKPLGSHHVVETHHQNRFSGMQHKDTVIEREYSLTIQRENVVSEGKREVIDRYKEVLVKLLETSTDDVEDIKNLRAATIEFLSILKQKETEIPKS